MPLDVQGFDDLMTDISGMADRLDVNGAGAGVARQILEDAARPIHQQMRSNASQDPRRRSGDLYNALKIGPSSAVKGVASTLPLACIARTGVTRTTIPPMWSMGTAVRPLRPRIPISVPPMIPARMNPTRLSVRDCGTLSTRITDDWRNFPWQHPPHPRPYLPRSA